VAAATRAVALVEQLRMHAAVGHAARLPPVSTIEANIFISPRTASPSRDSAGMHRHRGSAADKEMGEPVTVTMHMRSDRVDDREAAAVLLIGRFEDRYLPRKSSRMRAARPVCHCARQSQSARVETLQAATIDSELGPSVPSRERKTNGHGRSTVWICDSSRKITLPKTLFLVGRPSKSNTAEAHAWITAARIEADSRGVYHAIIITPIMKARRRRRPGRRRREPPPLTRAPPN